MRVQIDKTGGNKSRAIANLPVQKKEAQQHFNQFVDNRPEIIAQRKLKEALNNSSRVKQLKAYQEMADKYVGSEPAQQKENIMEQTLQRKFASMQQEEANNAETIPHSIPVQKQANNAGLPDKLKSGIESLSGYSMDDVNVHYNSEKPAQLEAHAYARGTDIHIGPGQEQHLPHEAWHVVQQKQGRVQATMQMKGDVNVNDDKSLEHEADVMGAKALVTDIAPENEMSYAMGIQANEEIIQAKSYTTTADKNKRGLAGSVDVATGDTSISLTGSLKTGDGKEEEVDGGVKTSPYKVHDLGWEKPERGTKSFYELIWSNALRVETLNAKPQGMKLGHLLTYHHALKAQELGKSYVLAMDVTKARDLFYVPLGFTDYNQSKRYADLKKRKEEIEAMLHSPEGEQMKSEEFSQLLTEHTALVEDMSNSAMIIGTTDLINNSLTMAQTVWNG